MKRYFITALVALVLLCAQSRLAQAQLSVSQTISVNQPLVRILADPVRPEIYGVTATGDIVFINQPTGTVDKVIQTHRMLTDINIAPDGSFLTVLDNVTGQYWNQPPATYLLTFDPVAKVQTNITFVQAPLFLMALGRQNRIAGVAVNQWVNVYEANSASGALLSQTGGGYFGSGSTDWQDLTLVSNPSGTRMYRTDIGISSISVHAYDISTDTITEVTSRGVGSYGTVPLTMNAAGSSLYVGDLRLNPSDLSVLSAFPETIYAGTGNDAYAFGYNNYYDPKYGSFLGVMPVHSTTLTLGDNDQYLYAWDSTSQKLFVIPVPAPEPAGLAILTVAVVGLSVRRRRAPV